MTRPAFFECTIWNNLNWERKMGEQFFFAGTAESETRSVQSNVCNVEAFYQFRPYHRQYQPAQP